MERTYGTGDGGGGNVWGGDDWEDVLGYVLGGVLGGDVEAVK